MSKVGNWESGKLGKWETGKVGNFLAKSLVGIDKLLILHQVIHQPIYLSR